MSHLLALLRKNKRDAKLYNLILWQLGEAEAIEHWLAVNLLAKGGRPEVGGNVEVGVVGKAMLIIAEEKLFSYKDYKHT